MSTNYLEENRCRNLEKDSYIYVHKYDEEDWNELLMSDILEEKEDGKDFLRVN